MKDGDRDHMATQLASVAQALSDIKEIQGEQRDATVELYREHRGMTAKMSSLETVVRMSLAEQKEVNARVCSDIKALEKCTRERKENLETEIRRIERKLAYFAGGLAVVLVVFDLTMRFVIGLYLKG